jgi:hypothetical protein
MLGAAAPPRIQKRILVREIVKAALRNDFDDRQRLVAENADGQLATGNKFSTSNSRSYFPASAIAASISRSLLMM